MGGTAPEHDPTVYPEEEKVGEELLQTWIRELLRPLLEGYLNGLGGRAPALVGSDQFIYFEQHNPLRRFAPDIYVLFGVDPATRIRSWKTWFDGPPPAFALEVVSGNWRKDYEEIPEICDAAGVDELVTFDPSFSERPGGEGSRFQIHRRQPNGAFALVERHDRDRAWSESLGVWLRIFGFGDRTRLRIATGDGGDQLVPTEAEAERAEKEAERAEKEAERAEKEAERAEKEAALRRVRELESMLRERDQDDD